MFEGRRSQRQVYSNGPDSALSNGPSYGSGSRQMWVSEEEEEVEEEVSRLQYMARGGGSAGDGKEEEEGVKRMKETECRKIHEKFFFRKL